MTEQYSPPISRFMRVPEDYRLLREFIKSNAILRALYIGAATGEDLICWLPATFGYDIRWQACEVRADVYEKLVDMLGGVLTTIPVFHIDFMEIIGSDIQYDVIVCNYVFSGGWNKENKRRLSALLEADAKILFLRDVVKNNYPEAHVKEYVAICNSYGYQVYSHSRPLDAVLDGCKRRDTGEIVIRRGAKLKFDSPYTKLKSGCVVDRRHVRNERQTD